VDATRTAATQPPTGHVTPDFASVLQTPLVLEHVTLMSYAALKDHLSLHLKTPIPQLDVADVLTRLAKISEGKHFMPCALGPLPLPLAIVSVTSTKVSTLLRCRTPKDPAAAASLFPLVGRTPLCLTIGERALQVQEAPSPLPGDDTLAELLAQAARLRRQTPEALLKHLTQFTRPDGSRYQGCHHIAQLSVKQRRMVYERLLRLRGARPGSG